MLAQLRLLLLGRVGDPRLELVRRDQLEQVGDRLFDLEVLRLHRRRLLLDVLLLQPDEPIERQRLVLRQVDQ